MDFRSFRRESWTHCEATLANVLLLSSPVRSATPGLLRTADKAVRLVGVMIDGARTIRLECIDLDKGNTDVVDRIERPARGILVMGIIVRVEPWG